MGKGQSEEAAYSEWTVEQPNYVERANFSFEVPHMMSPGRIEENEGEEDESCGSLEKFYFKEYDSPTVSTKKVIKDSFGSFFHSASKKQGADDEEEGHEEDLELMTVTVLDGKLDSKVKAAFEKVSENVHVLKRSSLKGIQNIAKKEEPSIEKELSPKSVAGFDSNGLCFEKPQPIYSNKPKKHIRRKTSPESLDFYEDKSNLGLQFRPLQSNSVSFQTTRKHKRVHSTGNYNYRSHEKPTLQPSRYISTSLNNRGENLYGSHREIRETKTWSYPTDSTQVASIPVSIESAPSYVSLSPMRYGRNSSTQSIFKSSPSSKMKHQHILQPQLQLSRSFGSQTEATIPEAYELNSDAVHSGRWIKLEKPSEPPRHENSSQYPMPLLLETIQDDSPYNSPVQSRRFIEQNQQKQLKPKKNLRRETYEKLKDEDDGNFFKIQMGRNKGLQIQCQCNIM